jgi:hypothetical protein
MNAPATPPPPEEIARVTDALACLRHEPESPEPPTFDAETLAQAEAARAELKRMTAIIEGRSHAA